MFKNRYKTNKEEQGRLSKNLTYDGFSLIELMVAAGTLFIVLIGIMQSFLYFFTAGEKAEAKIQALMAAQDKVEEIRDTNFDDIVDIYNGASFTFSGGNRTVFTYIGNTVNPELLDVEVSVCWRSESNNGRIIGEDQNLDGVLDLVGEDDGNGKVDSPLTIYTRVTR